MRLLADRKSVVWCALVLAAIAAVGCASADKSAATSAPDALYFSSPQHAVETSTTLLKARDWPTLARYYDLQGSPLTRAELAQGPFFYSDRVEGFQHPSGASKFKHPFAPGFSLMRTEPTQQPDTIKAIMLLEIDQGDGRTQRGMSAFLLRKHAAGWQILPEKVDP
jgi:hypothetical protein